MYLTPLTERLRYLPRDAWYVLRVTALRLAMRFRRQPGTTRSKRSPELIVSLTSIPERIGQVSLCVDSLLRQRTRPDRVILWLSEQSEGEGRRAVHPENLPPDLVALQGRGLEIRWCEDIGPYRKLVPALEAFPGALVVTADDDLLYPKHWLADLYEAYQGEPGCIHCHRAAMIRYDEWGQPLPYLEWDSAPGETGPSMEFMPTNGAGTLFAPGQLDPEVTNRERFLSLSPRADDVWFKAMSLLAGVPCKRTGDENAQLDEIRYADKRSLFMTNQFENDQQIAAVAAHYGVFRRRTLS